MNVLKYIVLLDMFDTHSQTTIKAKKCDSACQIHITLAKKGRLYDIGEGCYATFNAKKSDGNFIYDKCTIEGNTIVYDFSSSVDKDGVCQVSACEGVVECEVTLYNADSRQLTSPRFTLFIDGTVYNGEEIASSFESSVLKSLFAKAIVVDASKIPYPIHDEAITNVYGNENGLWDAKIGDLINHGGENKFSIVSGVWEMTDEMTNTMYKEVSYKGLDVAEVKKALQNKQDKFAVVTVDRDGNVLLTPKKDLQIAANNDNGSVALVGKSVTLYGDYTNLHGLVSVLGVLDFGYGNGRISNLGEPRSNNDAVNKGYIDKKTAVLSLYTGKQIVKTHKGTFTDTNGNPITLSDCIAEIGTSVWLSDEQYALVLFIEGAQFIVHWNVLSGGQPKELSNAIITTDNNGVSTIEEYEISATKSYVDTAIGNIETALDSIIAIQEQLIGGESV